MEPNGQAAAHYIDESAALRPKSDSEGIHFVTMGMFIIDDIDFPQSTTAVKGVLGGAGCYSALGARLFSPAPLSSTIGWIIDQGSDFPPTIPTLVDSWNTSAVVRHDASRLTTRGWNGYKDASDKREFRYTTPKKRLNASDLTPEFLQSRSFHLICSPTRCQELISEILSRRKRVMDEGTYCRPIFIWEPVPDLCTPDELLNCTNTLRLVDVCSPNHAELAGFMGDDGIDPVTGEISIESVERACEHLLASMPIQSFTLVIRAGASGCYIAKNGGRKRERQHDLVPKRRKDIARGGLQPDTDMEALFVGLLQDANGTIAREEIEVDPGIDRWIPAYHQDSSKVVDPTGGGNAFLGALAVALARGQEIQKAAVWGSVAASFAIEQVSMPHLTVDNGGVEHWNGHNVHERLEEFQSRI